MFALNEITAGSSCNIVWMIGKLGTWVKKNMKIEPEDTLKVLHNYGPSGMIVEANGSRYALSYDAANAIKVYLQ